MVVCSDPIRDQIRLIRSLAVLHGSFAMLDATDRLEQMIDAKATKIERLRDENVHRIIEESTNHAPDSEQRSE